MRLAVHPERGQGHGRGWRRAALHDLQRDPRRTSRRRPHRRRLAQPVRAGVPVAAECEARRAPRRAGELAVKVSGTTAVPMAAADLWAALSDPARLGEALPHVDGVETHSADEFSAWARPRTGLGETPLRMD